MAFPLALAVDATCVSPVTRSGEPWPGADSQPGLSLQQATRRKRRVTYLPRAIALAAMRVESGRCWGTQPVTFLVLLARARAARAHAAVRSALHAAYVSRLRCIIAVAAQKAFTSSLLELPLDTATVMLARSISELSTPKPISVTLFSDGHTRAHRHIYLGHSDRSTPTWAKADVCLECACDSSVYMGSGWFRCVLVPVM